MPNYKKIYLTMFRASEQAVNILIAAQQECEEHYISSSESELTEVSLPAENKEGVDNK